MNSLSSNRIPVLLFGLSEDLAGELKKPLMRFCSDIVSVDGARDDDSLVMADTLPKIIFCGADIAIVTKLRANYPSSPIVVVSRDPEVSDWLDSIEAGATDYCAAPFETSQMQWIVETSLRSVQSALAA